MNLCKDPPKVTDEKKTKKDSYEENLQLLILSQQGDEDACRRLCEINGGLVRAIAQRFLGRGVEYEDLVQIGSIGMLKAIRSFDQTRGCAFSTYAVPLIMGEIKRFLRDDGLIKIGREQKRLGAMLLREREKYIAAQGSEPGIAELAERLGVSPMEASDALEAVSPVTMLSEPIFDDEKASIEHMLYDEDECERTFDRIALSQALSKLPPLWRKIVTCRYFKDMSQQKTAELLSLTQVKVSREEKKILSFLRSQMT
ncbi:MAG: sigma-70 family RNA polymerase sigma factor [Clostridia bacterium]|nr:sigma-70 family RNA polymerase sigma factor [Clostridia bacterium]